MIKNPVRTLPQGLRRGWLALPLVVVATLVLLQAQATSASAPGERILPEEQAVVDLVNAERKKAGEKPLIVNYSLQEAAWAHNEHMIKTSCFAHTGCRDGDPSSRVKATGYKPVTTGENIAQGQASPAEVMDSWMNSSGHRRNILSDKWTDIGVAYNPAAADPRISGPTWTQVFSKPESDYRTVTPPRIAPPTPTQQACKIAEDVNADRTVDRADVDAVSERFMDAFGSPNWDPRYDIVANGTIDLYDIFGVVKALGTRCP